MWRSRPSTSSNPSPTTSFPAPKTARASNPPPPPTYNTSYKSSPPAAGVVVWPMVEFEADDALAAGAALAARDERVERVIICTPDKDLAQCVGGTRVVQLNRRTRVTLDEAGVIGKFGVPPASIPDYLALVGDAADGYPGLPGRGAKSSAAVLARLAHIESIPPYWRHRHVHPPYTH